MFEFNGALLIDKPEGISSFGVIETIQKALQEKYALKRKQLPSFGHGGTLDPFATGLLVIFVGEGVKLSRYFLGSDKTYTGTIEFGAKTESADFTTAITEETQTLPESLDKIKAAAHSFLKGEYLQTPPMYSAKKIDGVRLYEMARKGVTVEREAKSLTLDRFEVSELKTPKIGRKTVNFEVKCSSGTYVRTLAEDLAARLGTLAHLLSLRRTETGPYKINNAFTLDQIVASIREAKMLDELSCFVEMNELLNHFDSFQLSSEQATKVRQGNRDTVGEISDLLRVRSKANPLTEVVTLKLNGSLVAVMRKTDLFFELERVFQVERSHL